MMRKRARRDVAARFPHRRPVCMLTSDSAAAAFPNTGAHCANGPIGRLASRCLKMYTAGNIVADKVDQFGVLRFTCFHAGAAKKEGA